MILKIKDKTDTFEPSTLESIAKSIACDDAIAATVNGRLRELSYMLDHDADVEFINLKSNDAMRIYEASLRYVFAMAFHRLEGRKRIRFNYSISRAILAVIDDFDVTPEFVSKLHQEVQSIIDADLPIKRIIATKEEATQVYQEFGYVDKLETLKFRAEDTVHLYQCDTYVNYMFSYMVPSTGYLKLFDTKYYVPGFLIFYPRAELGGKLSDFVDQPNFGKSLKEVTKWGHIIGGNTIADINHHTKTRDKQVDFVNLCETKHNNQLADLGNQISQNIEDIKLIAVAGPSSSGKTTFTNRLRIELLARGIKPQMISMDDYYMPKSQAPKDADGMPDLEHVEALDVDRFNRDMASLVQGHTVHLPHFDFRQGKRVAGQKVKLAPNSPILIEGIHALNDRLTSLIPSHQKYKIFIAPQTQLHIDDHNPISLTDLRLIRRAVRDQKYRNSPFTMTMDMWPSVRRGEFRWIYPYQEDVNFTYNSELTYELCVLKNYALPHLLNVTSQDKHFVTANRLVKFLKYFKDIDDKLIPSNSILLEFIGGSPFHD